MKRNILLKTLRQTSIELFYVKFHHLPKRGPREYSEAKKIGSMVFPEAIEYKNFIILNLKSKDIEELIRLLENQIIEKFKNSMFPIKRLKWGSILKRKYNFHEKSRQLL